MTIVHIDGRALDPIHLHLAPSKYRGKGGAYFVGRITGSDPLRLIDYGQSEDVGAALETHPRRACWLRHVAGHESGLAVYLCESDTEGQRLQDEALVRERGPYPCRAS
jgi:hypothetical protein